MRGRGGEGRGGGRRKEGGRGERKEAREVRGRREEGRERGGREGRKGWREGWFSPLDSHLLNSTGRGPDKLHPLRLAEACEVFVLREKAITWMDGLREGGREEGREEGREGGREGEREGGREGGGGGEGGRKRVRGREGRESMIYPSSPPSPPLPFSNLCTGHFGNTNDLVSPQVALTRGGGANAVGFISLGRREQ